MAKIIIGIDPDSKKHGIAIYENGILIALECLSLMGLQGFLSSHRKNNPIPVSVIPEDIEVHIEDVNGVSAAFGARDSGKNIHVMLKMAQSIGMCKQAQIELERILENSYVKIVNL